VSASEYAIINIISRNAGKSSRQKLPEIPRKNFKKVLPFLCVFRLLMEEEIIWERMRHLKKILAVLSEAGNQVDYGIIISDEQMRI
jgi:hypothetical protein